MTIHESTLFCSKRRGLNTKFIETFIGSAKPALPRAWELANQTRQLLDHLATTLYRVARPLWLKFCSRLATNAPAVIARFYLLDSAADRDRRLTSSTRC